LLAPLVFPPCLADLEGIIQAGDGNAFLIAGLCIFNCRFMYFYYAENIYLHLLSFRGKRFFIALLCYFENSIVGFL